MLARPLPFATVTLCILITVIAVASRAGAESVVWSAPQPSLIAPGASDPDNRETQSLLSPQVSVSYSVMASEVDAAGNKIRVVSSGATVPQGTWVLFEFTPHQYTDIYWFGTGSAYDSPYGDWKAASAMPPWSDRCSDKNLYAVLPRGEGTAPDVMSHLFAALSVAPPTKILSVDGPGTNCTAQGENKLCTLQEAGAVNAQFIFNSTIGRFYPGHYFTGSVLYPELSLSPGPGRCAPTSETWGTAAMFQSGSEFVVSVPTQSIPFTLTVTELPPPPEDDPLTPEDESIPTTPTQPTVSASSAGACTAGQSHSISFTSTDPEGDDIRYLIDWNADGSVDDFAPSAGYVSSGETLSTSRTFATEGQKSVRVRAQDTNGTLSPWATLTFNCAESDEDGMSGPGTDPDDDWTGGPGGDPGINAPTLELKATPTLLQSGSRTRISWSATNVESCTVNGTNGDRWEGNTSPPGRGERSSPIRSETVYTLSCIGDDGSRPSKEVRVLTIYRESED